MFPIKLAGRFYSVKRTNELKKRQLGRSNDGKQLIEIRPMGFITPELAREVFIHEIVHQYLALSGVCHLLTPEQEEAICQALGFHISNDIKEITTGLELIDNGQ